MEVINLLRVLLVDDEMIVRYGIKSMINWEEIGLTIIGDASNGEEALKLYHLHNPEIVITDIKMPIMDGIELIQAIRKINEETKIIILSCYEEFAYAKEAIRLGASEYLIKSDMMPKDLESSLMKAKDSLMSEIEKSNLVEEIIAKSQKNVDMKKGQFFRDLASGAIGHKEMIEEMIDQLDLHHLKNSIIGLQVSIDYYEKLTASLNECAIKEMNRALEEEIEQILYKCEKCSGEIFSDNNGEVNLLLTSTHDHSDKELYDRAYGIGEKILSQTKKKLRYTVTVGISNIFQSLSAVKEIYSQVQAACKYKLFNGCNKIILYSTLISTEPPQKPIKINFNIIHDFIYFNKHKELKQFFNDIFNEIDQSKDCERVHLISLELVLLLNNIYAELENDQQKIMQKKKEYYDQIKYLETIEEFKTWFIQAFEGIMHSFRSSYNSDNIDKAIKFIQENYTQKITLQMMSDYLYLSKNYFVNLFKSETGESFVEYLTKYRIEKAKELLKDHKLKTSDVGAMVGIEDYRYFSKVFKKTAGMTPREYKEIIR